MACTPESDTDSNQDLTLQINGQSYSEGSPFIISSTTGRFELSWQSIGRTELYISSKPTLSGEYESFYGYNLGSDTLTCEVDSAMTVFDCDLNNIYHSTGSASIYNMVEALPQTIYVIAEQIEYDEKASRKVTDTAVLPIQIK